MTRLVLLMLRNRWAQALTLGVLAMVATASAVAAPAYLGAIDRAVVDREVHAASAQERSMSISAAMNSMPGIDQGPGPDFSQVGPALIGMPGFTSVFSVDLPILGVEASRTASSRLAYRQDTCAHLTMVAGRCLIGGSEVVIGQGTARRLGIRPGATVTVTFAVLDSNLQVYVPNGAPYTLTVVGIYRVPDPGALYWGTHGYFDMDGKGVPGEPVFTTRGAVTSLDHSREVDTVDVLGGAGAFAPDHLPAMRANLAAVNSRLLTLSSQFTVTTAIPSLLGRIDRGRTLAHELVPVAGVPLVVLAWFVIFLAVGYGTGDRRFELGLVALRGAGRPTRWALASGEYLVAIVVGAVVGYPVGLSASAILASARLDGPGTGAPTLQYALMAGLGAVLAALLAQRRELFTPVADLLRRVAGGGRRWRSLAVEVVVVLLAVVAAVQLRVAGGQLNGVGMLVPALVILAVALLGARAVVPLASRYGARALRRGQTGGALAAFQLGRRPGAHRLFVLLVVAVALLGFSTTAFAVAGQARQAEAQVVSGAPRVLTVKPVTRLKLLAATRAADPSGRYAMAVVNGQPGAPGDPPQLAVDTTRLATTAIWRPDFGGPGPRQLSALLRPGLSAPVVIRAGAIELDVTSDVLAKVADVHLVVVLAPLSGGPPINDDLGRLYPGDQRLVSQVDNCADGCRLVGFGAANSGSGGFQLHVTLRQVRTVEPAAVVVSTAALADTAAWRPEVPASITLSGDAAGLHIDYHGANGTAADGWITPADHPARLPVAATMALPTGATLVGLDGRSTAVTEVAQMSGLPRLGSRGVLVDLEYADRAASDAGAVDMEQVWLGPTAPPDAAARLRAQGLVVTRESTVGQLRSGFDAQGPAMALWFHLLTAGLGVLLAAGGSWLVAAVDRDGRAGDLGALRVQGVSRTATGRAGVWGYLVVVLAASVVGLLAAAVAWAVAGDEIPMFVNR
ncbi:MAG TPA: FtsX-like permease family protein, partial [Rugosimonospora sp.]